MPGAAHARPAWASTICPLVGRMASIQGPPDVKKASPVQPSCGFRQGLFLFVRLMGKPRYIF